MLARLRQASVRVSQNATAVNIQAPNEVPK
jgi:hypothetical protein